MLESFSKQEAFKFGNKKVVLSEDDVVVVFGWPVKGKVVPISPKTPFEDVQAKKIPFLERSTYLFVLLKINIVLYVNDLIKLQF